MDNNQINTAVQTPAPAPAPAPTPLPDTGRRDYVYFFITLLFSLLTANSIWVGSYQLGFAAGALALLVSALCYLGKNFRPTLLGIISLVSSFLIIASFGIHESTAFAFFKFNFLILSLSVFLVSSYGIKAPSLSDFRALLSPFYLFFGANIPATSLTAKALGNKNLSLGKKIGKVLLALLITMPLLLVLTFLLVYADRAFEGFIDTVDFNLGEVISTLMLGALLLVCTFPLLFAICKNRIRLKASERKPYLSVLDGVFVNTVLVSVSLLYLLFLVTQVSYLGGGFTGLLPDDYTYSAYARRGFFEMCMICVINLGIIFLSEVFIKRDGEKLPVVTRALNIFISLFSIFLIVSAIAKMFMYIRTYGLTFLRLGTSIFMFLLFFVFGSLVLKTFIKDFKAMQTVLAAACIIMALTSLAEPYNIIAGYNVYAYESGMLDEYELDTNYLSYYCGAYGEIALSSLSQEENVHVANRAKEHLENIHQQYYHTVGDHDLREMSLARYLADKALAEYYSK